MAHLWNVFRFLGAAVTALSLLPHVHAASCLDVQWCHCDAQNTLHCLVSKETELRTVAERLTVSPRLRLADLVVRGLPSLPGGLFRGTRLHGLLLSGSDADVLPANLLSGLEDSLLALGLGENRLTRVPTDTLTPLTRLERLDLSGNRLTSLTAAALRSVPQLQELNLADNEISKLENGTFSALPLLGTLSLEGNKLAMDQVRSGALSQLAGLQQLALDRNQLSGDLAQNFLSGLPNLTRLTLSENNLTSVQPGALMSLPRLRELDLSKNHIEVISDRSFSNLGKLETLRLDHNHVVTLSSDGFGGLKALKSLDLSHNVLQSVASEALNGLPNLRELFLRDNDVIYLDGDLFDGLTSLKRLDLSENPLHCDCRLRGLAQYLADSRGRLSSEDLQQVTCMTPSSLENAPLAGLTPEHLTCDETVQYDSIEPGSDDASHQIRLEEASLATDGGGAQLRWRVDPALTPYRCDQVFVFEPRADHEQHVASVVADCGTGAPSDDPTRLEVSVRWPQLRAGQPYRFCLVLVQLEQRSSAALRPSCSEPVRLATAAPSAPPPPSPPVAPPQPELAAFFANLTASGRVTVFLRVLQTPARRGDCVVTVLLLQGETVQAAQPMACELPLLELSAPGRPGAQVCVTEPHPTGVSPPTRKDEPSPETAQCVVLRAAAGPRWWQSAPAAVALGCLLALLLAAVVACCWCRLHGRCRLASSYHKWGGRPGVAFVRTATQPRTASEENINRETEETDSQV